MWSTSQPKNVSSSSIRQYSHRLVSTSDDQPAKLRADVGGAQRFASLLQRKMPPRSSFGQSHNVLQLEVMLQFGSFICGEAIRFFALDQFHHALPGRL